MPAQADKKLPYASTVSRALRSADLSACDAQADEASINNIREYCRGLVLKTVSKNKLKRITLDFDGSVITTSGRNIEGTAVGFNKKKKGTRSYYPLFCTIAQTGQVFDLYHRSGNVHDSNGAKEFILECISAIKQKP